MSTSRIRHKNWGLIPNTVCVEGSFAPAGTSAPSVTEGKGFSVSRTGVGVYRITFDDTYPALVAANASLREAAGLLSTIQFGDYSSANKTLDMRIFTNSGQSVSGALGMIPLPLQTMRELASNEIINAAGNGGLVAVDTTPALAAINAGTDQQLRATWVLSNSDKITWQVVLPPDLDDSADMTVNFLAGMDGATDTPALAVEAFFGVGDTDAGGSTAALSSSIANVSVTLGSADVAAYPNRLTITVAPGAHTTDGVLLDAAWITYQKTATANTSLVLADPASDADNIVNFRCYMRNSSLGG